MEATVERGIIEPSLVESRLVAPILDEFRQEALITRRVLERVPSGQLTWKPHEKSMSLGQLAWHVATVPGGISRLVQQDAFDASQGKFVPPQPKSIEEIMGACEQSLRDAEQCLEGMTDQQARAGWRLMLRDKEIFCRPRISVVRSIMLNHWYHHRGRLSVYLRLLDVPVPVIYGRSADENPFASL
jgi:uncharacterized damage-inducible protein DinB